MSNLLSIHKGILRDKYNATPLGQVEQEMKRIYNKIEEEKIALPEELLKKIDALRGNNEKEQLAYIERTNKEHAEYVDNLLLSTMTQEVELLRNYLNG